MSRLHITFASGAHHTCKRVVSVDLDVSHDTLAVMTENYDGPVTWTCTLSEIVDMKFAGLPAQIEKSRLEWEARKVADSRNR